MSFVSTAQYTPEWARKVDALEKRMKNLEAENDRLRRRNLIWETCADLPDDVTRHVLELSNDSDVTWRIRVAEEGSLVFELKCDEKWKTALAFDKRLIAHHLRYGLFG